MEKRTRNILLGLFGLGALCVICACVGAYMAPRFILPFMGFGQAQDRDEVLGNLSDGGVIIDEGGTLQGNGLTPVDVAPTPVVVVQELDQVTVELDGQSGTIDLNAIGVDEAVQGTAADGSEVYYFEYDEASLNEMLATQLWPNAPAEVTSQVQNVSIDLRPNAAIISGETDIGLGPQQLSFILGVDASNARFAVVGVELAGFVFETPPTGPIADMVNELEREGNRALDELVLYSGNGSPLSIQNIVVEDGRLRVTAGP